MSQNYQGPPQQGNYPPGPQQPPQPQAPQQAWQQGAHPQQGMPFPQDGVATPTKRKSKKTMVIAGALALALVIGGGVLAWSLLRGAAPAAAKGIPSNSLAVIEVSLNPSAGDKLAVKEIAEKFPFLKDSSSDAGDDYKKALWSVMAKMSKEAPDYESEVKPWLGDSVAIAALPKSSSGSSSTSSPATVLSVQISNKDAAKSFADKHLKDMKIVFVDDLMVVTNDTESDISESSLKDNITSVESYKADMGKLGDGYLATAWISSDLMKQVAESNGTGTTDLIESRYAMGLKVQDGALALRGIAWQKDETKERGENVKDLAGSMPANWLGSFTFSLQSNLADKVWEQLDSLPSSAQRQLKDLGITSADDLRALVGSQFSFAITGGDTTMSQSGLFQIGIKVHTNDPEKHKSIVEKIAKAGGSNAVETKVEGDTVITTIGGSAESFSNPSDKLSGNSEYEKLTKGIDNPQLLAWVNAPQVLEMLDQIDRNGLPAQVKENLEPISGIGVVAGQIDDHYFDSWLRIGTK